MSDAARINAGALASLLGEWARGAGPLHRRLAHRLDELIEFGAIAPARQLPSERSLARTLGVSRATVVHAYDVLRDKGTIESKQGSGTRISLRHQRSGQLGEKTVLFPWMHRLTAHDAASGSLPETIDLSAVAIPALPTLSKTISSLSDGDWRALTSITGYLPLGLDELRDAIVVYFEQRGLATSRDQVLVTTGAQQGLGLISSVLVQTGDVVAVEDPTYAGAIPVLQDAGAKLLPVPMDHQGMQAGVLREAMQRGSVRLIYTNPTFHNPTGAVMSGSRRRELAAAAGETGAIIVEGMALADMDLGLDQPPPPIAALDSGASVLNIGSMSSLFWTGLRIGWVRGPRSLMFRLGRKKATVDLGTSLPDQLVAHHLLQHLDEVRALRREQLLERCDLVTGLLERLLPSWTWTRPAGGPSLWVRLPAGDGREFAQLALRHGVAVLPGPTFSAVEGHADCLRIPFVLEPATLEEGVVRLASAWKGYEEVLRHRAG